MITAERMCLALIALSLLLSAHARAQSPVVADVVLIDGKIYTEDPQRRTVQALAVRDGKIIYVGNDAGAREFVGPQTQVEELGGKLVLPGLIDAHIHPMGIVKLDTCDLNSQRKTLAEITEFVRACIQHYQVKDGEWLMVQQWDFANGNQPDAEHPTIRAALDLASKTIPIQLFGNDGHHSGFNSASLALAKNSQGQTVGFSASTLKSDFSQWTKLIGVDATGEPNGTVNEDARAAMGAPFGFEAGFETLLKTPEKVMQVLSRDGITAIQDAAASPFARICSRSLAVAKRAMPL